MKHENALGFRLAPGYSGGLQVMMGDRQDFYLKCSGVSAATLLEWSIQKWLFIAAMILGGRTIVHDGGRATCACCAVYNRLYDPGVYNKDCSVHIEGRKHQKRCPIYAYTHKKYCEGTPYAVPHISISFKQAKDEVRFLRKVLAHVQKRKMSI